jgi:hypothetical protein
VSQLADDDFRGRAHLRIFAQLRFFHASLERLLCVSTPVNALLSFIDFAAVCNARHTDELRRVVNGVKHAPIACPDAPLILVAFQFFASRRPRVNPPAPESYDLSA